MFRSRVLNQIANPASSSTASSSQPTHHLITLIRSPIGLPASSRKTLEALGLYRLRESALHPFGETTAGRILKVKELVHVANVTKAEGEVLRKRRRSEGSGLEPSGRVYGGGKGVTESQI
ncbi:ribosomal protein L30 [Kwoniella mangroviensis CBS 8507]|uniref:mitochondrial 54S ribosomal protein uL30m n=1 Tax=Kwoniella mangroviensis CBS 8507 TaxID=1296122 RepID=UPI00080D7426|nr:ribosomal protein L30 [Kwoniella mangroviensis CBS 8507]OCF63239.1 ribosomal protein L30 [Kwoniella mangroviensis CBS 8507]